MNIYDLISRAQKLRKETQLDSVSPDRVGGLHEDTLKYINEFQLLASSPSLHKIYASVSAMQSDKSPKSDLTGKPLKPGQLVVIVPASQSDATAGDVYRYDGPSGNTSAWTFVAKIGAVPTDAELSATSTNPPQNKVVTEKLTELESNLVSDMSAFSAEDMSSFGEVIPFKNKGYIAIGAPDVNNPVVSDNYYHAVIPCKIGDIFYIQAKGGDNARLYFVLDNEGNLVTYTNESTDRSETGSFFRCFSDGLFVVNADIRVNHKLIRINPHLQMTVNPFFRFERYVSWQAGFIRWYNGTVNPESSVNQRSGYIPTFGYNRVRLLVNVGTGADPSTGIAFFDSERNYIGGIQSLTKDSVGVSEQIYNIPKDAAYLRTTIYNESVSDFFLELSNGQEDVLQYNNRELLWSSGYVHYFTGEIMESEVNSYTEIKVKNRSKIELTVNKTSSGASPGICFYDKHGAFILGMPYPNFGDSSQEATYVVNSYEIPYNAETAKISFFTRNISEFSAILHSGNDTNVENFANAFLGNVIVGHSELFISAPTADKYISLNEKTIEDLYAKWDDLVTRFPMFIRRGEDLGEVSDSERSYAIRQYVVGYRGRYLLNHEPGKDEIVSQNLWRAKDNPRKILLNCGMHGEEKTPCWGAALAIEELLQSNEAWATFIKANLDIYIIPSLNPYGFHKNQRGNVNGKVMNREEAYNEPEKIMYMNWIERNRDAFLLIDNHGSQGRYAYVPVFAGQPIFSSVNKMTAQLSAAFYNNYKSFYNAICNGYGETYSPFLLAKYTHEAGAYRCAIEMLDKYGMTSFALETPDNLVVETNGVVDESLSGLIGYNDLRCCKITKDLLINFIQFAASLPYNEII